MDEPVSLYSKTPKFGRVLAAFAPWLLGAWIAVGVGHGGAPWGLVWAAAIVRSDYSAVDLLTANPLDVVRAFLPHVAVLTTMLAILFCGRQRTSHFLTLATFSLLGWHLLDIGLRQRSRYGMEVVWPTAALFFFGWAISIGWCMYLGVTGLRQRKRPQVAAVE